MAASEPAKIATLNSLQDSTAWALDRKNGLPSTKDDVYRTSRDSRHQKGFYKR
jgi:hypothetical protein